MKRILYVQYTDPAGYPPLERSALLLANAGCEVMFAGIDAAGARGLRLQSHERITVKRLGGVSGGLLGPLKYAAFTRRVLSLARTFRPDWCYASEALAAPVAIAVRRVTSARIVYHEHDAPARAGSALVRAALRARAALVERASIVVIPSEERRPLLPRAGAQRAIVAWNCPLRSEVGTATQTISDAMKLVYVGSFSPDRIPLTYLQALAVLPPTVTLGVYSYTTRGHADFAGEWRRTVDELGLAGRVYMHDVVPEHAQLLNHLDEYDAGIATIGLDAADPNLAAMVGASNKPFHYMARGLPFLVSDTVAWRDAFVEPGYAVACDPGSADSIAAAIRGLSDATIRNDMGERARERILNDWNYETQFEPVLQEMLS